MNSVGKVVMECVIETKASTISDVATSEACRRGSLGWFAFVYLTDNLTRTRFVFGEHE
jgi:hypothetical protein